MAWRQKSEIDKVYLAYEEDIATLSNNISALQQQIGQIKKIQAKQAHRAPRERQTGQAVATQLNLSLLREGLYEYETKIPIVDDLKGLTRGYRPVTIYHIKYGITVGDYTQYINVGLATGKLTSAPLLYVDFDEDSVVDLDLMYKFVKFLPMGGIIAKSINRRQSQEAYDAFLMSNNKATFTSLEEIEKGGSEFANWLLTALETHSKTIEGWITDSLESEKQTAN